MTVETTFDPLTAVVTDATFPGLGALRRERLPRTGATDWVRAPNGCRQRWHARSWPVNAQFST